MASKSTTLSIKIIGDASNASKALGKAGSSTLSFSKLSGKALGAAAGFFSSLASKAIDSVMGLAGEMAEASDSAQKFGSTLKFAGVSDSTIKKLTASTQAYADKTVFSLSDIRNTTAQLASNGVKGYGSLAQAAGNLTAVAGGGADAFKSVSMMLTQTAGAGKLTTENWNQLSDAIPGASGKLQEAMKAAGAYTGNFRDAMAKGQITSGEFNAALMKLGMSDTAKKAAASTSTLEGASGNLRAAVVKVGSSLLTKFGPTITTAMAAASNAVTGFGDGLAAVGDWAAANGDVLAPIAVAVGTIVSAFALYSAAMRVATIAQAAFNLVMSANPIFLVITAIAALVAGLTYFFTQTKTGQAIWATLTAALRNGISAVVSFFGPKIAAIVGFFTNLWATVSSGFMGFVAFVASIPGRIVNFFASLPGRLLAFFMSVATGATAKFLGLVTFVASIPGRIVNFFASIPGRISAWFGKAAASAGSRFNIVALIASIPGRIVNFFAGLPGRIGSWFAQAAASAGRKFNIVNLLKAIPGKIIGLFSGIGSGISGAFSSAMGGIKSLWNSTLGNIQFDVPSWVPGLGGKHLGFPKLAKGGVLSAAGTVMVGEAGPELLTLPAGAQVTPLSRTYGLEGRGGGGDTYNFNIEITGKVLDKEGTAKELRKILDDFERRRR